MRQVAGRDADAGVGDGKHDAAVPGTELDYDLTAARRVLHRILDEVQRELAHAAPVYRHDDRLLRRLDLDADARMLGQELPRLPHLFDDLAEIDRLTMQIGAPLIRAREREQRLEQLRHAVHFLE